MGIEGGPSSSESREGNPETGVGTGATVRRTDEESFVDSYGRLGRVALSYFKDIENPGSVVAEIGSHDSETTRIVLREEFATLLARNILLNILLRGHSGQDRIEWAKGFFRDLEEVQFAGKELP